MNQDRLIRHASGHANWVGHDIRLLSITALAQSALLTQSGFVALFATPSTSCGLSAPLSQCGLLGLVRQIVVQTISNLAGSNTSQANSSLAKGDQYRNAGNNVAAYQQYRMAYKTATK